MYTYRPLLDDDLTAICSFSQTPEELLYISPRSKFPLTPEQVLNLLKDRYEPTVLIEETTGQVVGYANLYEETGGTLWLGNVIVAPSFRGRGAAQKLIQTMIGIARDKYGMKQIHLSCHNTNSRGLAFYHRLGFVPFGMRITTMDDHRTTITIQMRLNLV